MAKTASVLLVAVLGVVEGLRERRTAGVCGLGGKSISGAEGPGVQIVNGDTAKKCDWKWQVGLKNKGLTKPWCGGTLVAPDWVLTAAHCVPDADFEVVAGEHTPLLPSFSKQYRNPAAIYRHPQYNDDTFEYDFALVKLDKAMKLGNCVGTACLPTAGADLPAGSQCWITGWGTMRSGGNQPNTLQEAQVTTMSNEECRSKFGYQESEIKPSMLCARGRNATGHLIDACQGDSGGPLVCESGGAWTLHGVVSWGYGCAGYNYPGVYARTHETLDWIQATMA